MKLEFCTSIINLFGEKDDVLGGNTQVWKKSSLRPGLPEHSSPRIEPEETKHCSLLTTKHETLTMNSSWQKMVDSSLRSLTTLLAFFGLAEDYFNLINYALIFIKFKLAPNSLISVSFPLPTKVNPVLSSRLLSVSLNAKQHH